MLTPLNYSKSRVKSIRNHWCKGNHRTSGRFTPYPDASASPASNGSDVESEFNAVIDTTERTGTSIILPVRFADSLAYNPSFHAASQNPHSPKSSSRIIRGFFSKELLPKTYPQTGSDTPLLSDAYFEGKPPTAHSDDNH